MKPGAWLGLVAVTALAAVLDLILLAGWWANRSLGLAFDWRWPVLTSLVLGISGAMVIASRKAPLAALRGSDVVDE